MAMFGYGTTFGNDETTGEGSVSRYYVLTNEGGPLSGDVFRGFRKYNVLDYRSPVDTFDLRSIHGAIGYANQLVARGYQGKEVRADEVTIAVLRAYQDEQVVEVFEGLKARDTLVEGDAPGIYWLTKEASNLPLQIVIMGELEGDDNLLWRSLSDRTSRADMEQTIRWVHQLEGERRKDGRTYIDTLMRENPAVALELLDDPELAGMVCDILGPSESA